MTTDHARQASEAIRLLIVTAEAATSGGTSERQQRNVQAMYAAIRLATETLEKLDQWILSETEEWG